MKEIERLKVPVLAKWLVSRMIHPDYHEEFFGDLEEVYEERASHQGVFRAKCMYWVDTLHLIRGFASTGILKTQNNHTMLIRNMFKVAWRNALRQKQFSTLNLLGLTIGMATSLVIGLYAYDEMTFDTFHTKGDRIYRVNQPLIWSDWDQQFASTGPNVAIALREDAPEFEQVTRLLTLGPRTGRARHESPSSDLFREERLFVAEENFFDVFSFELLEGNPKTCLRDPMSMVMTMETAQRYFGYEDAIGRVVEVKSIDGTWKAYKVTGIIRDIPFKSHLQFDMLVSMTSYADRMQAHGWKWIWTAFSTYGLVKEGTNIADLSDKLQAIPPKWASITTERIFNQSFEEFTQGKDWSLYLQPLSDVYLSASPSKHRFGPTGKPGFVKMFMAIGGLVLVLSCINFMNLSTARASNRAKEVGIRKVLGSHRHLLIKQFIFESLLFVVVSLVGAIGLVLLFLGEFNAIADKNLSLLSLVSNLELLWLVAGFVIVLALLAGSYPALYLSSFRPIETLKGKLSSGFKGKSIRNGLVVFQFAISITLLICTFFVQKQLKHTSSMDLGFDKEHVLQLHNIEELGDRDQLFKDQMALNPMFTHVGKSYGIPPNIWDGERYKTKDPETPVVDMSNFRAEEDYIELMGLNFLAGRNFDAQKNSDRYGVILNEKAVKLLGWGTRETFDVNSPIGKKVVCAFDNEEELSVLGVVEDFNYNSVKEKIEPLVIINHRNDKLWNYGRGRSFLSLRINPNTIKSTEELQVLIEDVRASLAQIDDSILFEYSFMDKAFEKTFKEEQKMGVILKIFTAMALIIACLGLFGLAAFSAEQRIKELGIRKVLGARTSQLIYSFSFEFARLVLISMLIAAPLAYYLVDLWLTGFAFRTPIDAWIFAWVQIGVLLMALLIVGYQSFVASRRNPADVLINE